MDQYTNYFDALSQTMYSQQSDAASPFLSQESHPPSLSGSPVSSEASDSLVDEAIRYGLFGYDHSPAPTYSSYNQRYAIGFPLRSIFQLTSPLPQLCQRFHGRTNAYERSVLSRGFVRLRDPHDV
jgi:hypothetical protein